MGKINGGRVILGGLLAGVVINIFEYVFHGVILEGDWAAAMAALNKTMDTTGGAMAIFICWSFLIGIAAVWFYAAIRPRYGAGPRTALCAGLAMWVLVYLQMAIGNAAMGLFPGRLIIISVVVGLVEIVLATLLGAWVYKEQPSAA